MSPSLVKPVTPVTPVSGMNQKKNDHFVTSSVTIIGDSAIGSDSGINSSGSPSGSLGPLSESAGDSSPFAKTNISGNNAANAGPPLPDRIGHYKILRLIGAGGMGAVYEAEQDQPRRTVALKIMRGAIASPQASRRFEYESQLLARLRHPYIAQVYEAGTHQEAITGAAVPFFAMEFIPDAKELTAYATAAGLSRLGRIELFAKICDAVQHGHQRGVIHRDLKPANILIDTTGLPKIIDFGVARATHEGEEAAGQEKQTKAGQMIGTLQYMAPEQCGPDSSDIDVRADVYALGVILFELLTGKYPHDLEGTSLFAAAMMVREDPPKRPSSVDRTLRGDLETIILKSLEKDRAKRYASATDLALDLQRHVRCEPILARHIGATGRLVRWVKRHRAVATVVAISAGVLITTSVVLVARILRESHRANVALADAQRNLQAAKDNFSLIKTFFGSMRPNDTQRGLVNVEALLDNAAKQLITKPPELEATEADFREIIAGGYQGLSKYSKSIEHQTRVIALRQKLSTKPDLGLADSMHQLAAALWWNGQYDEAAPLYENSLAIRKSLLGAEHEDIAMSLTHLAACRLKQGHLDEARKNYLLVLDMRRKLTGPRSPEVAASINNLAKTELLAGEFERAEMHSREALAMIRDIKGDDDLNTASARNNLAMCLFEVGKNKEARDLFNAALQARLAKYAARHHLVALSRLGLARTEFAISSREGGEAARQGAVDEALAVLTLLDELLPSDNPGIPHPDITEVRGHVGLMLAAAGKGEAGVMFLRMAVESVNASKQATKRDRDEASIRLGLGLLHAGKGEEALAILLPHVRGTPAEDVSRLLREYVASALKAAGVTEEWR